MYYIGGVGPTITRLNAISSNYFSMIEGADGSVLSLTAIVSLWAGALATLDSPISWSVSLAIRSSKNIKQATYIAVTWAVVSLPWLSS